MSRFPYVISNRITLSEEEVEISAIRAQGAGGQNVNKVSTAVHLRFDIKNASLPDDIKDRLLLLKDSRISSEGILVIKAQRFRSREKNIDDALERLADVLREGSAVAKKRVPSRPTRASKQRRVDDKVKAGRKKAMRQKVSFD